MKKLITLAAAALFAFSSLITVAQTDKKADPQKAKQEAPAEKSGDAKLKKDGTPDKRYKENKEPAKQTGPLKKDGTPDKRYKENKKG
jgi:hypothetical protein